MKNKVRKHKMKNKFMTTTESNTKEEKNNDLSNTINIQEEYINGECYNGPIIVNPKPSNIHANVQMYDFPSKPYSIHDYLRFRTLVKKEEENNDFQTLNQKLYGFKNYLDVPFP